MQWIHLCTGFLFSKGVDFSLPEQIVHWGKVCWGKHWCCAVENAANIGQSNPSLSTNGRSTWSQAGSASSHKIRCRFQNIILFTEHECKLEIVRIIMTNTHLYDELGLRPVLFSRVPTKSRWSRRWRKRRLSRCLVIWLPSRFLSLKLHWNLLYYTSYITSSNWMMEVTNTHHKGWLIGT